MQALALISLYALVVIVIVTVVAVPVFLLLGVSAAAPLVVERDGRPAGDSILAPGERGSDALITDRQ